MFRPDGIGPEQGQECPACAEYTNSEMWVEADVERACQTAFLSGWNAARNFPALDVDAAWQDWKDYLATTAP